MKQSIKRLTALILAVAMCLGLASANVWATEPELQEEAESSTESSMSTNDGESSEETLLKDGASSEESNEAEESPLPENETKEEPSEDEGDTEEENGEESKDAVDDTDDAMDSEPIVSPQEEEVEAADDSNNAITNDNNPKEEESKEEITTQSTSTPETSSHMWYQYNGNIDIRGYNGGSIIQTTYSNAGYFTVLDCDGKQETLSFSENGAAKTHSSGLSITPNVSFSGDGKYAIVTLTVNNPTTQRKTYSLGVHADVDIDSDDRASVYKTTTGLKMVSSSNKTYYLVCKNISGVTKASTLWFGFYSSRQSNVFNDCDISSLTGKDSGLAFSWKNKTSIPGSTDKYVYQIGIGESGAIGEYSETGYGFRNREDTNSFNHFIKDFFNGTYKTEDEISKERFSFDPLHSRTKLWIKTHGKEVQGPFDTDGDGMKDKYYVVKKATEPKFFTYSISNDYNRLISNEDKTTVANIQKKMNDKWNGACHGVAISMALASQKIGLNDAGITSNYHDAGLPKDNIRLRDTIHYYHLSQYTSKGKSTIKHWNPFYIFNVFDGTTNLHNFLSDLVEEGRRSNLEQKPFVFGFNTLKDGHSIVAYGLKGLGSNRYEINLFDENGTYESKLTIDLNKDTFSFQEGNPSPKKDSNGNYVELHQTINNSNYLSLEYLGIDDLYGTISTLSEEDDTDNHQTITISANKKCKIVNNSGKYLAFDGSSYSGTMTVYDIDFLGEDENAEIRFYVDPYSSLTMTNMEEEIELTATINNEYYSSRVENADKVVIGNQSIFISGDEYVFSSYTSAGSENADLLEVTAQASGETKVVAEKGRLKVDSSGTISDAAISSYKDISVKTEEVDGNTESIVISDGTDGVKVSAEVENTSNTENDKAPDPTPTPAPTPAPSTVPAAKVRNTISGKTKFTFTTNSKKKRTFKLGAKAKGSAKISYKSNKKEVTVKSGKVTIKKGFVGKATIKITSAATDKYLSTTKKVYVYVNPTVTQFTSVKWDKKNMIAILNWKRNKTNKGYELEVSTQKNFKRNSRTWQLRKSTVCVTFHGMPKGKYFFRIRTVNGKCCSAWSKVKTLKVP